ncbi:MAG: hypothetical protein WA863_14215 [Methyloceanibacter sp.]
MNRAGGLAHALLQRIDLNFLGRGGTDLFELRDQDFALAKQHALSHPP